MEGPAVVFSSATYLWTSSIKLYDRRKNQNVIVLWIYMYLQHLSNNISVCCLENLVDHQAAERMIPADFQILYSLFTVVAHLWMLLKIYIIVWLGVNHETHDVLVLLIDGLMLLVMFLVALRGL
uniref:Uncharacterized protein n=1 Tax=Panagrolaimus sp. ES5 TaxID=591445 RepID=A0AC34GGQ5_9BILA